VKHVEVISVSVQRKRHTAQFKFQIAMEAIKNDQTVNQLASKHGLHPSQISQWKRQLLEEGASVFGTNTAQQLRQQTALQADLYEQIGRLKMELEWLKKRVHGAD
jgi:putative transposase